MKFTNTLIFIVINTTLLGSSFKDNFSKHENTMTNLPQNKNSKKLLEKYKPRIFIYKGSYKPINFYKDSLPNTILKNKEKKIIKNNPNKEDLEKYYKNEEYYLDLQIDSKKYLNDKIEVQSKIYGRIYIDKIGDKYYLFLKYNMVFPYNGLPASTSKFKLAISSIIGNKKAWHELDIHGAYRLIIDEETMEAVGILLNQHNYHHSFVLGKDFILPDNGKIKLAISKYSNEPYLWK